MSNSEQFTFLILASFALGLLVGVQAKVKEVLSGLQFNVFLMLGDYPSEVMDEDEQEYEFEECFVYKWGDRYVDFLGIVQILPEAQPHGFSITPDEYVSMHQRQSMET